MNRATTQCFLYISLLLIAYQVRSQSNDETNSPAATLEKPISNVATTNAPLLAEWQQRFTLGPGDVVTVSLFEQPSTERAGLVIGPDGRINYLQAQNIMAAGLTVDELRNELERVLSRFYLAPKVILVPQVFRSKKYFLLGNVNSKGVFLLTKPVSLIEAVARAQGFSALRSGKNAFVMTDFSRSFLVRRETEGSFHPVQVDLEGLFLEGKFDQNIQLAPDDYLYFAPMDLSEVYVLGEVNTPGIVPMDRQLTLIRAIAVCGGFTSRAFKQRVLIIRGSLHDPHKMVANITPILNAQVEDYPLQPGDIVYVSQKPWQFAQDLLELAISSYVRAVVVTWTGRNVGPFTQDAFIPSIDGQ